MPRGGKREGSGAPKKYEDLVEIRIRCDRDFRDEFYKFLASKGIRNYNAYLQEMIRDNILEKH